VVVTAGAGTACCAVLWISPLYYSIMVIDTACTYTTCILLRMGCSLPALVAIPLGPFLSASPSNLVRGPGAGAGPEADRWDRWDRIGWDGRGRRGIESRWDEEPDEEDSS
jgi:hypothetical protein